MQLFKLLNLLKEDDYFIEDFDKFKEYYLDYLYKFKKDRSKEFLDKITGYISYLNREKDVRQFAYPVIYIKDIEMSSKNNKRNIFSYFFEDIKDYVAINLDETKNEIIKNLKEISKNNSIDVITQEQAFDACMSKKGKKQNISTSSSSLTHSSNTSKSEIKIKKEQKLDTIKEFIKESIIFIKDYEKKQKEEEKAKKKAEKEEEKAIKKAQKEEEKAKKNAQK
jgi:hypothetical protein